MTVCIYQLLLYIYFCSSSASSVTKVSTFSYSCFLSTRTLYCYGYISTLSVVSELYTQSIVQTEILLRVMYTVVVATVFLWNLLLLYSKVYNLGFRVNFSLKYMSFHYQYLRHLI